MYHLTDPTHAWDIGGLWGYIYIGSAADGVFIKVIKNIKEINCYFKRAFLFYLQLELFEYFLNHTLDIYCYKHIPQVEG
jgi:hypothetical protein